MAVNYKKVYCLFFDYDYGFESIPCEICEDDVDTPFNNINTIREAVDIHHISPRGSSKCCNINETPNLIALCREHHIEAESSKKFNKRCKIVHLKNMIKKLEE